MATKFEGLIKVPNQLAVGIRAASKVMHYETLTWRTAKSAASTATHLFSCCARFMAKAFEAGYRETE
jgi:hypothetical protein